MPEISIFNITLGWGEKPELTQYLIADYYKALTIDNLVESCFYDGSVRNYADFFSFCLDRTNLFLIIYERDTQKPLAHVTLNCFEGYTCRVHFGITKSGHGREISLELGHKALEYIFGMTRSKDGTPVTRMLVGLTPTVNRLACRWVLDMGYTHVATLDQSCFMAKTNTFSDGLLTTLTRKQFEEAPNGWKTGSRLKTARRI